MPEGWPAEPQPRRDPQSGRWKVAAREASFVHDVHLIEQPRCRRMAFGQQSPGQIGFRLEGITKFIVIRGRQVAEAIVFVLKAQRAAPSGLGQRGHFIPADCQTRGVDAHAQRRHRDHGCDDCIGPTGGVSRIGLPPRLEPFPPATVRRQKRAAHEPKIRQSHDQQQRDRRVVDPEKPIRAGELRCSPMFDFHRQHDRQHGKQRRRLSDHDAAGKLWHGGGLSQNHGGKRAACGRFGGGSYSANHG